MKYKFCSIRINVNKYDDIFATKGGSNPQTPVALRHCCFALVLCHGDAYYTNM